MNIMPCRLKHLTLCLQGYEKTGIALTEFFENKITSFGAADDIGIYVIIPKLAHYFNLDIAQAINIFFYGSALISWGLACIGFFFYYHKILPRIIAILALSALMLFSFRIGDTYLFYVEPAIALVPWSLYFYKKNFSKKAVFFILITGIIIGLAHYIRTYASLGILFFIVWLMLCKSEPWQHKSIRLSFLLAGLIIPMFYFSHIFSSYSFYLKNNEIENPSKNIKNHLIWHSIYAGLGFLAFKNPDDIRWDDSSPAKKAQALNQTAIYNTPEYEEILKNEVLRLVKNHTAFIVMTIFAKIGILLFYLLIFANFGLIAAFFKPQNWSIEIAFWGSLIVSSIFSILTIPTLEYSLGFITFATLYGITSINYCIHNFHIKNS